MLRGFAVTRLSSPRAGSEATDDALWTMRGLHSGADHLREKVDIVVSLTRHLFANRVQDFQEFWATLHNRSYRSYTTYITLSVASDTKNSGVTIMGT